MNRITGTRIAVRFVLALLVYCLLPLCIPAEQTLDDADWFERELGAGVVWRYYLFDDLFNSMQSVSYIEVDLTNTDVDVEIPYLASSRDHTSSMIPDQFPEAVGGINGTYFDTSAGGGGHETYLRVDNTEIPKQPSSKGEWSWNGAMVMDGTGHVDVIEMPDGGWETDTTHPGIIANGPILVVEGTIQSSSFTSIGPHCTARHPRSAIGVTDDERLILLTTDGRTAMAAGMTCQELAEVMVELGCTDALNMDGGGSTTLWGEGELYNGVLNYPSDNGLYDHSGERACSNAVAVESTAPSPKTWDARLTGKTFQQMMDSGAEQTATLTYDNIGTATWTADDTKLVLARPVSRTSNFYDTSWHSSTQPALMSPETVAPGETATFSFVLKAPVVSTTAVYNEHFMLTQDGVGRIGPADSEAWMRISVQPPVSPGETFIVESRSGGQNFGWYSDSGMANSGTNCTAPGCTGDIGTRYGSTYRSVAGFKKATAAPEFPEAAYYNVYVAWGEGAFRRSPITYHVNHANGTDTFQLDQTATANVWVQLGASPYLFNQGFGDTVEMTNEDIDVSGSMYAGAIKFEYLEPEEPDKEYVVNHLESGDAQPAIDGVVDSGEWDAASPAGTGYVLHNDPTTTATEDGAFSMLFDDTYLYILFQMNNAYLAGYPTPPPSYGYYDLGGDKINFYLTPFGVNAQEFYRILLCPNPTDTTCYVWSQAGVEKSTDAGIGTDWDAGDDAAYTYTDTLLTIEYRIPWNTFDYTGIDVAACPEGDTEWGVQPCITNELTPDTWEYVNWEPDDTPSYIYGEPFGALKFNKTTSNVCGWIMY